MSENYYDTPKILIDYLKQQNYYKLIGIDLSIETKQIFLNILIPEENQKKMMLQQFFYW